MQIFKILCTAVILRKSLMKPGVEESQNIQIADTFFILMQRFIK